MAVLHLSAGQKLIVGYWLRAENIEGGEKAAVVEAK